MSVQSWDHLKRVIETVSAGQKQGPVDLRSASVRHGDIFLSSPLHGHTTLEVSDFVRNRVLEEAGVAPGLSVKLRADPSGKEAGDALLQWALRQKGEKYAYVNGRSLTALHDGPIAISSERLIAAVEKAAAEMSLDVVPRNVFIKDGAVNAQLISRAGASRDPTASVAGSKLFPGMNLWNYEDRPDKSAVEAFLFRGICTNGVIFGRAHNSFSRLYTSNTSQRALEQEMMRALGTSVREGRKAIETVMTLSRERVQHPERVLQKIGKVLKLDKHKAPVLIGAWQREPHASRWGVVNALTRYSQTESDPAIRYATERYAGSLMTETTQWQSVQIAG